ncbi:Uncharacterised protein [uncultured archaeon]|nr:Uncharacterised protein [uncultured archaeon]
MAKLTAWLVTLTGVFLILAALGLFSITSPSSLGVLGAIVLIIGIGKLVRNYKKKRK